MRKKLLLCGLFTVFSFFTIMAQRTVTGKVTDASNKPVSNASITVKGANVGVNSDENGNFSIQLPKGKNTISVSSIGYEEQDVRANENTVNISLSSRTTTLNDVVVTGYTSQRKKEITGSVAVVNVAQLKQSPVGTGEEALQGRASGVTILTSGQPGAQSDIRIRGITSFGNNAPLVIVDGVRGDLHDINPSDIESLQVLKDASAAIYGLAGSNGVVIITTKKGKSGKAKVSYDAYYGVTTRGPGYSMANTQQEANAIWQQQRNSVGFNGTYTNPQYGTGTTPVIPDYIQVFNGNIPGVPHFDSKGRPLSTSGYTLCNCAADSVVDPRFYDLNTDQITKANKAGTNWYDVITRNAITQSHNLSVSAGTDKSAYFFSVGYLDQQGIADFSYLKRYTVRANTQFTIKDKIRVGENAYIFYKQNPTFGNQGESSPFSVAFREDAIIPVYDIEGNFAGTKSNGLGNAQNPYANLYRTRNNTTNNWDIQGNIYAEADFLRHFTIRTSFGGTMDNNYGHSFSYVGYENAEGNTGADAFSESAGYNTQWTFTNTLNYSNSFGQHTVKVLVGSEAVNYYGRSFTAGRSNYFSEDPNYTDLSTGSPSGQSNSGNPYQSSLWSQFARLDYSYAGKYLINGSIRRDGSSVFLGDKQHAYFPAVSAAWRISQENFLKSVTFINDLKIRYSWGKLGSTSNVQATNPYNLYNSSAGHSYYAIDGSSTVPTQGFYHSNIANQATTFEGDVISNIGFDATILKNKIDVTIDYYKKKVNGLLFPASGTQYDRVFVGDASLPYVNIGDMQNTGIDLNFTYHGTVGKDFKYDVGGSFTSYDNKIISIPGLPYFDAGAIRNVSLQRNQVGHSIDEFFGYKVIGLFKDSAAAAKAPTQQGDNAAGLFQYADINHDGKIDASDRTFIGNPNPKFTYGINISFSYKNFDFSTFFFGSAGNDIFNFTKYYTDFPDFFKGGISKDAAIDSWTPTNTGASIPKLRNTGGFSTDAAGNGSSYFISKGSYLRNKQMQIGYVLPSRIMSKIGVDRFRIYVQSANMFTITKYKGLDPELSSSSPNNGNSLQTGNFSGYGIDQGNYPHTPSYLVGVNLNF